MTEKMGNCENVTCIAFLIMRIILLISKMQSNRESYNHRITRFGRKPQRIMVSQNFLGCKECDFYLYFYYWRREKNSTLWLRDSHFSSCLYSITYSKRNTENKVFGNTVFYLFVCLFLVKVSSRLFLKRNSPISLS